MLRTAYVRIVKKLHRIFIREIAELVLLVSCDDIDLWNTCFEKL